MKQILKGLLIVVAMQGYNGLQADDYITSIEYVTPKLTEREEYEKSLKPKEYIQLVIAVYQNLALELKEGFTTATWEQEKPLLLGRPVQYSRNFIIEEERPIKFPRKLKNPIWIGKIVSKDWLISLIIPEKGITHTFDLPKIRAFDEKNKSGKWLLKINAEGVPSFEKDPF